MKFRCDFAPRSVVLVAALCLSFFFFSDGHVVLIRAHVYKDAFRGFYSLCCQYYKISQCYVWVLLSVFENLRIATINFVVSVSLSVQLFA